MWVKKDEVWYQQKHHIMSEQKQISILQAAETVAIIPLKFKLRFYIPLDAKIMISDTFHHLPITGKTKPNTTKKSMPHSC